MTTITEDYVSFEIAKLLREKGFDYSSYCHYRLNDGELCNFNTNCNTNLKQNDYITAPTLQMAMDWLREDKKILVSIFCHTDKGYWFCIQHFIESPYRFATSESVHRKEEILGKIQYYDTYEEAVEAAIKYCLENLI